MFSTARIERPPLYPVGSASEKNGLLAPSHHSEAARLREQGELSGHPLCLGELTPPAERRSLSLALESLEGEHHGNATVTGLGTD